MDDKQRIMDIVDDKQDEFIAASDRIWDTPETRFAVKRSVEPYYEVLEKEGFSIRKGIAGMEYAFIATWGSGSPVIGITAEYDALGNLSQEAGNSERKPLVPGGAGQGCGHNVLGTTALGAAVALKTLMEEKQLKGTLRLYGCPAEESGYGKAFMARDGVFDDLDAAFTCHPMDATTVVGSASLAVMQANFEFTGVAAHAAAAPEMGRDALDAAELMNVGVQFLREHIIDQARIHYAFLDAGGESANVVHPSSKIYYFVRAPRLDQVKEIYDRVVNIAKGAALMTDTTLNIDFDSACANYIPNHPLSEAMDANLDLIGPLQLTPEELAFEKDIQLHSAQPGLIDKLAARAKEAFPDKSPAEISEIANSGIALQKLPLVYTDNPKGQGSTDVGDVSWCTPTTYVAVGFEPQGMSPHSWQWVANGKSSVAHKGLVLGAKTIALTAYDALTNPDLLKAAREAFERDLDGATYTSVIPPEVVPH
ncbi:MULTISPECIES: amidohydrolase [Bifidobacterium]|jgi:aminobenzoyl-glutamate utilization protein B|uniref:Amidohydrolase n=1 Tax=Bifidobacterium tibiigranuli TaxID=2172043 RepID=A0A5N6S4E0_9BIFI|nr:amidohydrolase [Bifidobacterium tibiigranuli]KAE8128132.1 amidohydrolase [Bifidobacterium tibiigranuli]KAE8128293.1 amidohydrolase [Bifidobacterium tibiigranuli]MCH3973955.1 amidohydrolase [Bifidobacterium tibiigranuli]MCI1211776.1 amidohydrolase [Bifidobacterium tibiigranuli]MCI1221426.1 amidohydrolase [Bifidobacterium tibiigranuli]